MILPTVGYEHLEPRIEHWRREIRDAEARTQTVREKYPDRLPTHLQQIDAYRLTLASEERAWALCVVGRVGAEADEPMKGTLSRLMEYVYRVTQ